MSKAFQLSIFYFNFWQLNIIYHIYYKPTIQKKKKREKKKLKELHFSHFQYKLKTLFFFNCAFIFCQNLLRNLFFSIFRMPFGIQNI